MFSRSHCQAAFVPHSADRTVSQPLFMYSANSIDRRLRVIWTQMFSISEIAYCISNVSIPGGQNVSIDQKLVYDEPLDEA